MWGGVQTRTVECIRNDGVLKAEKFCSGISKPATSQVCNTHACYPTLKNVDDCGGPPDSAYVCRQWGSGWLANYYQVYFTNPGNGTNIYLSLQVSYKSRRQTGDGTVGFKNLHDNYYNEVRSESVKSIINYDAPNPPDTGLSSIGAYRRDSYPYSCYNKGSWRGGVYVPKFYVGTAGPNDKSFTFAIYKERRNHDHGLCITIENCFVE